MFRWDEATNGRTDADDARAPTHDASPTANDDARQAGHGTTRQIRQNGLSAFFVAMNRRYLVRRFFFGSINTTYYFFLNLQHESVDLVPVFITIHLIKSNFNCSYERNCFIPISSVSHSHVLFRLNIDKHV